MQKINYIGNLKFSQTEKNENYLNNQLKKFFHSKKIWCASSTHIGEEILCARAHIKLKNKYKNLITVIIPRHIDRTNHIVESIKKLELKVHLHSSKTKVNPNTDIYLVNAYGMTKSFFQICNTVFLGGSIIRHGGQNPLEPSRYGCKVLHGPNVWNFKEIYSLLNKYNVSSKVNSINQIANKVDNIFVKKIHSHSIKSKINLLGNKILKDTLNEINFLITPK